MLKVMVVLKETAGSICQSSNDNKLRHMIS